MTEQQKFQSGDRVKVTFEMTVVEPSVFAHAGSGTVYPWTVEQWADENHIDVELIERPAPPREPGWYVCRYDDAPHAMRWDGEKWHWLGRGECVLFQDEVVVLGTSLTVQGAGRSTRPGRSTTPSTRHRSPRSS